MNKLLIPLGILMLYCLSVVGAVTMGPTQVKEPASAQFGGDYSCYDAEIFMLRGIVAADPNDPAIPGMEIQARAYAKLFEEQQSC